MHSLLSVSLSSLPRKKNHEKLEKHQTESTAVGIKGGQSLFVLGRAQTYRVERQMQGEICYTGKWDRAGGI